LRAGAPGHTAPISIPLLTGALAFAVIAWTLLQRSAGLSVSAYDTAFFEQVVWNLGRGRGFTGGFFPANFLGLHFSPLLALPAAVELAWPDTNVLALLQAAALGLSAPAANTAVKSRHTLLDETQRPPRLRVSVFFLFSVHSALSASSVLSLGSSSRNRRTRRSTFAYIAGVSSPVCVFCWLGW